MQPDKVAAISAFGVAGRDGKRENNPMHSRRLVGKRSAIAGPEIDAGAKVAWQQSGLNN
ncbi:hypothetical protein [Bradyrhizobium guangzhouense]|uniref:hypothetical protein n=1 Tax=Bradyrhizobium guangzhouense TaxID=1325095 RepID=UPI0013E8BE7C|nr:hypothetical protein [Bradyrhizobium guangzhouense]